MLGQEEAEDARLLRKSRIGELIGQKRKREEKKEIKG